MEIPGIKGTADLPKTNATKTTGLGLSPKEIQVTVYSRENLSPSAQNSQDLNLRLNEIKDGMQVINIEGQPWAQSKEGDLNTLCDYQSDERSRLKSNVLLPMQLKSPTDLNTKVDDIFQSRTLTNQHSKESRHRDAGKSNNIQLFDGIRGKTIMLSSKRCNESPENNVRKSGG